MKIIILALAALTLVTTAAPTFAAVSKKTRTAQAKPAQEQPPAAPINILSIIPANGEPGISVTLSGTGFAPKMKAFLGNIEVSTTVLGSEQISFDIPKLAPGLYALFLTRQDGTSSRTYNFNILPPKPVVDGIAPDSIFSCSSGTDREVLISGSNFQEGSQVLFDGAIIRSKYNSSESLSFTAPQVPGGLHQVMVRNPQDTQTTPIALFINSKPEISSISKGDDFVSYYNLIIRGNNFQQGAKVIIQASSFRVGASAAAGDQLTVGGDGSGKRELVIYEDCTQLIYQRAPNDPTDKDLRIQVINPNGEASSIVQATAP